MKGLVCFMNNGLTTERTLHETLRKKITEASNLLFQIDEIQKEHEPGGCFYETTKKILEMYRYFKYDSFSSVVDTSIEEFKEYGIDMEADTPSDKVDCFDFLLVLPKNMYCNRNELLSFVSSSAPASIGKFVHLIDSSMKVLEFEDKKGFRVLNSFYLDRNKKTKEEAAKELGISLSTFFRKEKIAITELSILIFGPLGEKHPDFSLSRLNKDYHSKLFDVADKIDELFVDEYTEFLEKSSRNINTEN